MSPREMLDLPEVPCPRGGNEACCGYLYFGRRLCGFSQDVYLEILMRTFEKIQTEREQRGKDLDTFVALGRAHRRTW